MSQTEQALSILDLFAMKQQGEKISCLTVYDASFSQIIDQIGIDVMLVGDSLGMVVQGHSSTIPVTIEQMVYHTLNVSRTRKRAFLIADLPFLTYCNAETAIKHAAKLMQESQAQMVKLEGAHIETIRQLVRFGVPVCGHLGLLPQSINQLGRYKVQGKQAQDAAILLHQAEQMQEAGISLLVLECVPAELASKISHQLDIPVIGIGAGIDCDGQVLVLYDMLGISSHLPRFCKNFLEDAESIRQAILDYHTAVKETAFPSLEQSY